MAATPRTAMVLLAVLLLATLCLSCGRHPLGQRIVLITIDTLRYDSFAGGAGGPSSMPLTLALSRKGLVFDRCYAPSSSTQPSHSTLFTALQPWEHGVTRNGQILDGQFTTVAEIFKQAGFRTAAVVGAVPVESRFGFSQGFDTYDEKFTRGYGSNEWEGVQIAGDRFYEQAEKVTATAIDRLERTAGDRQFFWFHYFDPHAPYGDSGEERSIPGPLTILTYATREGADVENAVRNCRRLYNLDVSYVDRSLERLFEHLRADESEFETSIIFVSDHGESLGEGGSMGHGDRLSEEQLHVPLFILSARVRGAARSEPVGLIDIAPTLLSLAGVRSKLPAGRDLTAAAIAPAPLFGMRRTYGKPASELRLDGSEHPLEPFLFYRMDTDARLITGNSKRIVEGPAAGMAPDAAQSRQLLAEFQGFEENLGRLHINETQDEETLRALRALGYVR